MSQQSGGIALIFVVGGSHGKKGKNINNINSQTQKQVSQSKQGF